MKTKGKKLLCILLAAGLLAVFSISLIQDQKARAKADPAMKGWNSYTVYWFDLFDTVISVVGYAPSQQEWTAQMNALHDDLEQCYQLFDIYNEYPGVTNMATLNRIAADGPVQVAEPLMQMLIQAKQGYRLTQGKANVAMGAVLRLWHDARTIATEAPEKAALPSAAQLADASTHCDISNLILNEQAATVQYSDPNLRLDVGSVAKGFAVEYCAQRASQRGLASAFLNVGGNLRAIGHTPEGNDWIGGLEDPDNTSTAILRTKVPDGYSMVTSGDYKRYFVVDGERYCHLIDPETLYPASYVRSVTVVCADSGLADCLSTGLFCMPLEQGKQLLEALPDTEGCWLLPDGSVETSSGWLNL